MKKILSILGLLLFYILFSVVVMEAGVRLFDKARPAADPDFFWQTGDPVTGWKMIPNASGRWFNNWFEYDTTISVNERSLRAPADLTYEKPEGVFRVIVLGDSFVEAAQVELAESFPQQLGDLLRQQGLNAQVINAGVGGWGNDQELIWLREEGYKYKPDLVVLAVFPRNDFMNNYQPLEAANMRSNNKPYFRLENGQLKAELFPFDPATAPPVENLVEIPQAETIPEGPLIGVRNWLWAHSALYRYIDPRIRVTAPYFAIWLDRIGLLKAGDETEVLVKQQLPVPMAYNVYHNPPTAEWQSALDLTGAIFAEVKRLSTEMGAKSAGLVVTAPEQVMPEYWQALHYQYPQMQSVDWSLDFPSDKTVELFNKIGMPVLNPLALFRQRYADGDNLHFYVDGHWTAQGHRLVARQLFNFLAAQQLLPQLEGVQIPETTGVTRGVVRDVVLWVVLLALLGSLLWSVYKNGLGKWLRTTGSGATTAGELLAYIVRQRQFFLLPVVLVLLLFGALLVIAQASVVGPFIYTLF